MGGGGISVRAEFVSQSSQSSDISRGSQVAEVRVELASL